MATASQDKVPSRTAGRPRDDATAPALLRVTRQLVTERGYKAVSTQQIAAAAGVAKQTLYRRWPTKADLVLDAFIESVESVRAGETGALEVVMRQYLIDLFENLTVDGPAIRSLIATGQEDPEFLLTFRHRFVKPRADVVAHLLDAARRDGAIGRDADVEVAVECFHGAFWYRLLQGQTLNAAYAQRLAQFILSAVRTG